MSDHKLTQEEFDEWLEDIQKPMIIPRKCMREWLWFYYGQPWF